MQFKQSFKCLQFCLGGPFKGSKNGYIKGVRRFFGCLGRPGLVALSPYASGGC